MKKDFVKLSYWFEISCIKEKRYVAYINPKYIRYTGNEKLCSDEIRSRYNFNSGNLARIGRSDSAFRNGTHWFIHSAYESTDKYFEGIEDTVAITIERVKEIMEIVLRRAFADGRFYFQDNYQLIG